MARLRRPVVATIIALGLALTSAHAAGVQLLDVPAAGNDPPLKGAVWYPCAQPPGEVEIGGIALPGVRDCPVKGERLPLIVISHGAGGVFTNFHDMAEVLADSDYVVAAIDHPGNTGADMSRVGDLTSLVERPPTSGASSTS